MKNRKIMKPATRAPGFKGEIVDEKDHAEEHPTGRYMKNNPFKTPPNNLTTKGR